MNDKSVAHYDYSDQVRIVVEPETGLHTRYAGALAYQRAWHRFDMDTLLSNAGIRYGQEVDRAPELSLAWSLGPLVQANSLRKVVQRFGGDATAPLERDELLVHLLATPFSQRTLDRFASQPRYDWAALQWGIVAHLQQQPGLRMQRRGIIIWDDFPLPKPYATAMPYLSPIWDNNLKMEVPGYLIVHLYYYDPKGYSYSLYMEPWLKTTLTGETVAKTGRRRARPGEERSRLDIGLEALEHIVVARWPFEAVIMDNWYTVRWVGHELTQCQLAWIGEADSAQKFQVGLNLLSEAEIWERYAKHLKRLPGFGKGVRAYGLAATIVPDQYTHEAQPVQLVLTEGLHQPREKDQGRHLLVCSQRTWTVHHIVRLFSYRPKIEPTHRSAKQEEGWLAFHTRNLPALLGHLALSCVRATLLTLMRVWEPQLADYSLAEMITHWIGYVADLTHDATGRLVVHLGQEHPALALIRGAGQT